MEEKDHAETAREALARRKLAALAHLAADVAAGVALERNSSGADQEEACARIAAAEGAAIVADLAAIANTADPKRLKAASRFHSERARRRIGIAKSMMAAGKPAGEGEGASE